MEFLPLFHQLANRQILIVGGGMVALRKARLLISAGANLHVIAKHISPELIKLLEQQAHTYQETPYQDTLLQKYSLIILATDNPLLNQQIAHDANALNIPVNVVDNPALSSVIFPAIIDRSPIMVAVATGGSSPVLARLLRTKLETALPANYAKLALLAKNFREKVKKHFTHPEQRRIFWEQVLQGSIAEKVLIGQQEEAEHALTQLLDNALDEPPQGEVYIIHIASNDPDLLTIKALRLMQQADIIMYDEFVSPTILALCRRDAEHIGTNLNTQQTPLSLAQQGKRVAWLIGGTPITQNNKEIIQLAQHTIAYQIIPCVQL